MANDNQKEPKKEKDPSIKDQLLETAANRGFVAIYRSPKQIFWANLLGGMAWGFGTVVGATLIVAVLIVLLDFLGGIPLIGSYIHQLTESITSGPATPTN